MRTLLVACGNTLRGDDGVAHEVLREPTLRGFCETRGVQQFTPELAPEIGGFDAVVFLDADPAAVQPGIEIVGDAAPSASLSHAAAPNEIVALARALYGFAGTAYLCRIPATDFRCRESLSPAAQASAAAAAANLRNFLIGGVFA